MKLIYFIILSVIINNLAYSQIEIGVKQYQIIGDFSENSGNIKQINGSVDNSIINTDQFNTVIGIKSRYTTKKHLTYEVELIGLFGKTQIKQKNNGVFRTEITVKPQPSNILLLGIGKNIQIEKFSLNPSFKIGYSHTRRKNTQTELRYDNETLTERINVFQPKLNSLIVGPSLGFTYEVFKNFNFGLEFDYHLYIINSKDEYSYIREQFDSTGTDVIGTVISKYKYDSFRFNFSQIGASWAFYYRFK